MVCDKYCLVQALIFIFSTTKDLEKKIWSDNSP